MSDQQPSATMASAAPGEGFTWHPTYAGKSYDAVYGELVEEIGRDQRQASLAMEGAEGAEHDSLTTLVELDRRWGIYDFDWAETDPKVLASRILTFEKERERRQELFSFADYRASGALVETGQPVAATPTRTLPIVQIGIVILVILVAVLLWIVF